MRIVYFLFSFLCFSLPLWAEFDLKQEFLSRKPTVAELLQYPKSLKDRPLVLPARMREARLNIDYRHFSSGHFHVQTTATGRLGLLENLEGVGEVRAIPGRGENSFQFGGITAGAQYQLLKEQNHYVDLSLGGDLGFLGKSRFSLTGGNNFALLPRLQLARRYQNLISFLQLQGVIGDNQSGLLKTSLGSVLSLIEPVETGMFLEILNVGLKFDTVVSLNPTVYYHAWSTVDFMGQVKVSFVGSNLIGNNFTLGIQSRF